MISTWSLLFLQILELVNYFEISFFLGYLGNGDCLQAMGNMEGALNSYTKAIEADKASPDTG
jgi:hypothetical protein